MATSRGRKSTTKKKEEKVVESPKKEVIEPKVEEPKKAAPKKAAKKVEAPPVKEELPPPPPVLEPEPIVETVVEPVAEVAIEQEELPVVASEPVVEQIPQMGIGSVVHMPGRLTGTIVSIDRKGRFEVKCDSRKRKIYAYEASQLVLVK